VRGNKAGKVLVQEVKLLARHLNADAAKLAYITKLTSGAKHGLYFDSSSDQCSWSSFCEVGGALVMES
jgi:hypothetical protein